MYNRRLIFMMHTCCLSYHKEISFDSFVKNLQNLYLVGIDPHRPIGYKTFVNESNGTIYTRQE